MNRVMLKEQFRNLAIDRYHVLYAGILEIINNYDDDNVDIMRTELRDC